MSYTWVLVLIRRDTRSHENVVDVKFCGKIFEARQITGGVVAEVCVVIMTSHFDDDYVGVVAEDTEVLSGGLVLPHLGRLVPRSDVNVVSDDDTTAFLSSLFKLIHEPSHHLGLFTIKLKNVFYLEIPSVDLQHCHS